MSITHLNLQDNHLDAPVDWNDTQPHLHTHTRARVQPHAYTYADTHTWARAVVSHRQATQIEEKRDPPSTAFLAPHAGFAAQAVENILNGLYNATMAKHPAARKMLERRAQSTAARAAKPGPAAAAEAHGASASASVAKARALLAQASMRGPPGELAVRLIPNTLTREQVGGAAHRLTFGGW